MIKESVLNDCVFVVEQGGSCTSCSNPVMHLSTRFTSSRNNVARYERQQGPHFHVFKQIPKDDCGQNDVSGILCDDCAAECSQKHEERNERWQREREAADQAHRAKEHARNEFEKQKQRDHDGVVFAIEARFKRGSSFAFSDMILFNVCHKKDHQPA